MIDNAFFKQVNKEVEEELKAQVEHLNKMSNNADELDDKVRFGYMHSGANTVLNILANSTFSEQGTDAWLKKLDQNQLNYAKRSVESLLKKMEEEDKVTLWETYTEHSSVYHFKTFEEASTKVLELIKDDSEKYADERNDMTIRKIKVRESEVSDYLS